MTTSSSTPSPVALGADLGGVTVVVVTPDGTARIERWTPTAAGSLLDDLQAAVGGHVDVVRLARDLDMWVHDEGIFTATSNPLAGRVAHALGHRSQPYFGTVVFTGGADEHGATAGLGGQVAADLLTLAGLLREDGETWTCQQLADAIWADRHYRAPC